MKEIFSRALPQWEDFHRSIAFQVFDRYCKRLPSFTDDVQATATVALAGILTAVRITNEKLSKQRIVYAGAGAAGVGIGRRVKAVMLEDCRNEQTVRRAQLFLDSQGLLCEGRAIKDPHKIEFALTSSSNDNFSYTRCDWLPS